MLDILFVWAILAFVCFGLACLVGVRRDRILSGFVCIIGALQVWHLFWPVAGWTLFVLLILASVGVFIKRVQLAEELPAIWSSPTRLALVGLIWLFVSTYALGYGASYDAGLYHFQTIRWIHEYHIVTGLANLNECFGYNTSWFLWGALTRTLYSRPHHIMAGFLIAAVLCKLVCVVLSNRSSTTMRVMAAAMVYPVLLYVTTGQDAHDTGNDCPAGLIVALLCLTMLEIYERRDDDRLALARLCAYSALAVTVKLSTALVAGLAPMLIVGVCVVRYGIRKTVHSAIPGIAIAGALLGVWVVRSIILSGYPAFPSTFGAVPVSWRVPAKIVERQSSDITLFSRVGAVPVSWRMPVKWDKHQSADTGLYPHPDPFAPYFIRCYMAENWRWFPAWFSRWWDDWRLSTPVIFLVLLIPFWLRCRKWHPALLALPFVAGTTLWFFAAPQPRFLGLTLWCVVALLLTAFAGNWVRQLMDHKICRLALVLFCFVLAYHHPPIAALPWTELPQPTLTYKTTDSGLTVAIPVKGEDQAWDCPLSPPCTPYFRPGLRLRGRSLGDGFQIGP